MAFDGDQLKRVAWLARLHLAEDRMEPLSADIERVLGLFDSLQQAAVDGIEPMAHPLGIHAQLRSDEVTEPDMAATLLTLAPQAVADLYLVPRVIE